MRGEGVVGGPSQTQPGQSMRIRGQNNPAAGKGFWAVTLHRRQSPKWMLSRYGYGVLSTPSIIHGCQPPTSTSVPMSVVLRESSVSSGAWAWAPAGPGLFAREERAVAVAAPVPG